MMNDQVTTLGHSAGYGISQEERHKVLRNTYWLLALSMIPTVLGAWIGVATGITQSLSGGLGLIVFMGGAFGFMYAIEKTKNSAAGVPVLLAFTFFMGLMLSRLIGMVLGFKNGTDLIMTAFAGTAGVFFVMASLASVIKRDLSGMGKWLMVGALVLMVGAVINVFVGSTVGMMVISMLATGITQSLRGGVGLIVFLGGAFAFMFAIEKTKRSAAGVPVLLAFTFFMGLMLSRLIGMVLGFKNGTDLIMTAFAGTAGVFFVMASLASVIKRDLSGMGKWLMVGALVLMVGGIINVFVGSTVGMMVISMLAIGIFSAYMLYDLKQILDGGETNYISATLALYLDIFNVFQSLLALLGIMGGERE